MIEDRKIYITGRFKNRIVLSGCKKVFPEEVETVLENNPNFAEIGVFGATRKTGAKDGTEEIMTVIVPAKHVLEEHTDEDELQDYIVKEVKSMAVQLAPYKRPVNIIVRKEPLPRTSTNKVKRNIVKEETMA